ncbi:MAG: anthranilate phosphoribosyltransferase [Candidatus Solibacter usitatus]|nr:anthranilate phosphoribosyltransferase [Candidatus Solibacter usitatus]
MPLLPFLHRVLDGESLSAPDARLAMEAILAGEASAAQVAAFLVALRMKNETAEELTGFARAMRQAAEPIPIALEGRPLLDTCGTGGDGAGTFNISTIAAFVIAGAGVRVAKHGNRSISSKCGSADLMEALGVNLTLDPERIGRAIGEVGIGFLFAPALHKAMRFVQPVRVELKTRTVFNLLGPLTNPAGATAQLAGAPSEEAAGLMAQALAALDLQRGFVVHGADGLDEITTVGPTHAFEIQDGQVTRRVMQPEDFGVPRARPADLKGSGKEENLRVAEEILAGFKGPRRDIVLVNAAAGLVAAGCAADFSDGMKRAAESLDSGAARGKVRQLAEFSRR